MNIKIRSTNFDITPAIDDYLRKKISSLQRFLPSNDNILCEVEIGRTTRHHKSGDIFKAEINISQPGVKQIYAVAEEIDIYTAIDIVRDETEREITSAKDKRNTLFKRGGMKIKELLKKININRRK